MERIGNCLENASYHNMTMDFSGIGKINELHGFRLTGAINVTHDIKGVLGVRVLL